MQIIADLQLHSRFSRAVSPSMTLPHIAGWARRKGIGLVATGDWTHPLWFREIQANLEETGDGLLRLKADALAGSSFGSSRQGPDRFGIHQSVSAKAMTGLEKTRRPASLPLFLLATEVSCIYSQGGKLRRVHTLIWVPTLAGADKINKEMTKRGCNLMSDGRPIVGLSSIELTELVLSIESRALIIPAHAWTPWFSLYGSMSGFDSIAEAFGPFTKNIYAIETGLSSNPAMNWRIKELDERAIISFSDAHSGPKLGREATVFDVRELTYEAIYAAIRGTHADVASKNLDPSSGSYARKPSYSSGLKSEDGQNFSRSPPAAIAYTIEFYPEEGKYHYTGHRLCNIRLSPQETKEKGSTCPVCGKPLTIGVMHRVEDLAGRSEAELKLTKVKIAATLVSGTGSSAFPDRRPFIMLVPLQEILSEAIGSPVASPKVQEPYQQLVDKFGGEFSVLLKTPISEITKAAGERIAQGIDKVRSGDIVIEPGYDGVFGVVKIWKEGEQKPLLDSSKEQLSMF